MSKLAVPTSGDIIFLGGWKALYQCLINSLIIEMQCGQHGKMNRNYLWEIINVEKYDVPYIWLGFLFSVLLMLWLCCHSLNIKILKLIAQV